MSICRCYEASVRSRSRQILLRVNHLNRIRDYCRNRPTTNVHSYFVGYQSGLTSISTAIHTVARDLYSKHISTYRVRLHLYAFAFRRARCRKLQLISVIRTNIVIRLIPDFILCDRTSCGRSEIRVDQLHHGVLITGLENAILSLFQRVLESCILNNSGIRVTMQKQSS